jgi:hypothetical protein
MDAKRVETAAQAIGKNRIGPPRRRDFGDERAAIAQGRSFDDDAAEDRPSRSPSQRLGGAELVARLQRHLRERQAHTRAGRRSVDAIGSERSQRVKRRAMMQAPQGFADQPAKIVEPGIVWGESAMSPHRVEWIVDPHAQIARGGDFLAAFAGSRQALGRRAQAL